MVAQSGDKITCCYCQNCVIYNLLSYTFGQPTFNAKPPVHAQLHRICWTANRRVTTVKITCSRNKKKKNQKQAPSSSVCLYPVKWYAHENVKCDVCGRVMPGPAFAFVTRTDSQQCFWLLRGPSMHNLNYVVIVWRRRC